MRKIIKRCMKWHPWDPTIATFMTALIILWSIVIIAKIID